MEISISLRFLINKGKNPIPKKPASRKERPGYAGDNYDARIFPIKCGHRPRSNVPQGRNVSNRRWSAKRGTGGRRDHQDPSSARAELRIVAPLQGFDFRLQLPPVPQAR